MLASISIHALLAESDETAPYRVWETQISIHALLAESDQLPAAKPPVMLRFLSTLSLRRATTDGLFFLDRRKNFYPRSPCGERLASDDRTRTTEHISIHALLAESDHEGTNTGTNSSIFLSTLSLRRATLIHQLGRQASIFISIHALLAESDLSLRQLQSALRDFYPRSPCGERP